MPAAAARSATVARTIVPPGAPLSLLLTGAAPARSVSAGAVVGGAVEIGVAVITGVSSTVVATVVAVVVGAGVPSSAGTRVVFEPVAGGGGAGRAVVGEVGRAVVAGELGGGVVELVVVVGR